MKFWIPLLLFFFVQKFPGEHSMIVNDHNCFIMLQSFNSQNSISCACYSIKKQPVSKCRSQPNKLETCLCVASSPLANCNAIKSKTYCPFSKGEMGWDFPEAVYLSLKMSLLMELISYRGWIGLHARSVTGAIATTAKSNPVYHHSVLIHEPNR